MKKALIAETRTTAGSIFICYFRNGSEWQAFHCRKEYKTLAGAKRALVKLGFNEIVVE